MPQLNTIRDDSSRISFDHQKYKNYRVSPDASFISNIRRAMKNTFLGGTMDSQKQKIREELVRDYIQNQNSQPADIRRVLRDLFESWYY